MCSSDLPISPASSQPISRLISPFLRLPSNFNNTGDAYTRHQYPPAGVLRPRYRTRYAARRLSPLESTRCNPPISSGQRMINPLYSSRDRMKGRGLAESKYGRTAAGAGASHPFLYPKKIKKNNKINNLRGTTTLCLVFSPKSPGLQGTMCPVSP